MPPGERSISIGVQHARRSAIDLDLPQSPVRGQDLQPIDPSLLFMVSDAVEPDAHDLTGTLLRHPPEDPRQGAARERMLPLQAGIERARKLTEQLLSLARLQADEPSKQELDVAALARDLIAEQLPLAEIRGIDLGLDERAPVRILAAPDSVRLVLRNGLENVIKFGRIGGKVTLGIDADAHDAIIEVIDDGPGIPAAGRDRVLEPFRRLAQANRQGSGLGLSIAREAAMKLGGSLELAERNGQTGLIFRYRQRRAR